MRFIKKIEVNNKRETIFVSCFNKINMFESNDILCTKGLYQHGMLLKLLQNQIELIVKNDRPINFSESTIYGVTLIRKGHCVLMTPYLKSNAINKNISNQNIIPYKRYIRDVGGFRFDKAKELFEESCELLINCANEFIDNAILDMDCVKKGSIKCQNSNQ